MVTIIMFVIYVFIKVENTLLNVILTHCFTSTLTWYYESLPQRRVSTALALLTLSQETDNQLPALYSSVLDSHCNNKH